MKIGTTHENIILERHQVILVTYKIRISIFWNFKNIYIYKITNELATNRCKIQNKMVLKQTATFLNPYVTIEEEASAGKENVECRTNEK